MPKPLSDDQITAGLAKAEGWTREGDELTATYKVGRANVLPFYTAVAAVEDELNHHANVHIVYGTVVFKVNTHDAGNAITELDIALAEKIAAIAAAQGV
jgi:4a-hydroxytetrahydrobiopterin dehydratase